MRDEGGVLVLSSRFLPAWHVGCQDLWLRHIRFEGFEVWGVRALLELRVFTAKTFTGICAFARSVKQELLHKAKKHSEVIGYKASMDGTDEKF